MSVRKGNSDTRLTKLFKPKVEEDNLDNFLPKFLLKDLKEDKRSIDYESDMNEEKGLIFEPHETKDVSENLKYLSIKEVIK